ncbi:MAG: T9SS type A sorting domain-containing protein [Bacteroidales bacterium]|nr:T9SS type A sorting domain-containing protein [Bacteroidales bacterium]
MKTLLLFASLALSINAFAQSKHPTFDPQLRTSNPRENVQGMMKDAGSRTTNIYSEINLEQDIKHQTITQRSLIQIYDSIYYWDWDMDNVGWKINSKAVDVVYDANNNLTSEIYQMWNDSIWINWYLLTYTYDANNFKAGYSCKHYSIDGTEITSGDSTYYYFHTVLGINDLTVPLDNIKVYPNPASTTITIALPSTTPFNNTTLSIYNVSAQQVISRRITEPITILDISTLPLGVYFVRITTAKTVMVGKFVKQ